jgi:pyridoxamine 5'-phosphate oxidase
VPEAFEPLLESHADPDPLVQFGRWFDDAATVVPNPEAMAVASVGRDGRPSVRMVLLKSWGEDGFVFHTNYDSQKGRELAQNPHAALLFYWEPRGRQVRIEGAVERTGEEESDAYFATRPRGGQIGAYASHQSEVVGSRALLDTMVSARAAEFAGQEVPRPPWWGGVRVRPQVYEFWQNRDDRLHDRLRYEPAPDGWRMARLQP